MNKKEELAQRIMEYLRKNPDAGDTLEGITNWWLQLERIEQSVDEVLESLEDLVKKGLVVRQDIPGGTAYYKFSKQDIAKT